MRHGLIMTLALCRLELRMRSGQRLNAVWAGRRQAKNEDRSTLSLVVAGDLPAVILHDSVDCAQAEAGALADGLGRIEGIEDTMRLFDSGAAIGKLDDDLISLLSGDHLQRASVAFFEGVKSVFEDLDEGLKELMTVSPNPGQVRLNRSFDTDFVFVRLQFAHLHAALQKRAHVDHRFFVGALLGKAH
jgi:hypothetical protein